MRVGSPTDMDVKSMKNAINESDLDSKAKKLLLKWFSYCEDIDSMEDLINQQRIDQEWSYRRWSGLDFGL